MRITTKAVKTVTVEIDPAEAVQIGRSLKPDQYSELEESINRIKTMLYDTTVHVTKCALTIKSEHYESEDLT